MMREQDQLARQLMPRHGGLVEREVVDLQSIGRTVRVPSELGKVPGLRHVTPQMHTGVYFLIRGDQLHYVGQSVNVIARLTSHHVYRPGDQIYYVPCRPDELCELEAAIISATEPAGNGRSFKNRVWHEWAPRLRKLIQEPT
jgi:hypothetical protein